MMKSRHLLNIIMVELEDLISDLMETEEGLLRRLADHSITDYVYKGNDALLKRELMAIESIRRKAERTTVPEGQTPEKTAEAFMKIVQEDIQHLQSPIGVVSMIERRVLKALQFIDQ